jgi:hypothetical protein
MVDHGMAPSTTDGRGTHEMEGGEAENDAKFNLEPCYVTVHKQWKPQAMEAPIRRPT